MGIEGFVRILFDIVTPNSCPCILKELNAIVVLIRRFITDDDDIRFIDIVGITLGIYAVSLLHHILRRSDSILSYYGVDILLQKHAPVAGDIHLVALDNDACGGTNVDLATVIKVPDLQA